MHRHHWYRVLFCLGIIVFSVPAAVAQHLYVGNNATPGGIRQFSLPLSGSSTPNFTTSLDGVISVEVDASGDLVAGDLAGNISFFPSPLSGATTRSAFFPIGGGLGAYQLAFTSGGDLFVASTSQVHRFNRPFSNFSVPAQTLNIAGFGALGLAIDAAQNLYVTSASSSSNLLVYAPPYTGVPVSTPPVTALYRKLAVSATQLFVAVAGPGNGRVDVYDLPITSASAPAFSITAGTNVPEAIALDSIGNLYVGNLTGATVMLYRPPFSSSSTPAVTLALGSFSIFGLAVEKTGLAVLPAVASASGALGSFFRTGVQLSNANASPMSGRIVFHPAGTSAIETDPSLAYALNPGETQNVPDLVQAMGQSGLGSADLIPGSGGFPTVVARVFNDAGSNGTAGFTEDLVKQENALGAGDQFTLIVPADVARFRYNIGVRSLAAGASITVTQRNSTGNIVRTISKTYAPNYFEQVSASSFLGGAPSTNDSIAVSVGSGSLFIYGATTDNTTQDPSVQMGRK
jgi:hypothetical protein